MVPASLAPAFAELVARLEGLEIPDGPRRLISATVRLYEPLDPAAVAFGSRLAGDRWFCWEEPDRGLAIGAVGAARELVSRGDGRFDDLERDAAAAVRGRIADEPAGLPAGAGPLWAGGFAFDPEGGGAPHWASLPPALLTMPEVSLVRDGEATYATAAGFASGREHGGLVARLRARLAALRLDPLPMHDPHPGGEVRIAGARPPHEFERAVAGAVERIAARGLDKVVLAREVRVTAPAAIDPAATFGALRELFPSCFCFCVGTPEAAFVGASPELLVRRAGAVAATVALAGTTRRSADPVVDDHLGEGLARSDKDRREHEIVARRIERLLRPLSVWVQREPEPSVVRVANLQHLATPIRAQLAEPRSAVALAGYLHPTPAVGGEPRAEALAAIAELEGMDRGWYAGPVGWMDATEDGEFCVGLRSVLLRDRTGHAFAGGGIVAGSDPAAELAETEVKLEATVPLLAG